MERTEGYGKDGGLWKGWRIMETMEGYGKDGGLQKRWAQSIYDYLNNYFKIITKQTYITLYMDARNAAE